MNGYGQEIGGFNPQLAEAIAQQERLRQQQAQTQQMMRPSGGAGGKADIVTALLGGIMSNRTGNKIQKGEVDINRQIAEFQQQQAQAQEIKKEQDYKRKIEREDLIRKEKSQAPTTAMKNAQSLGLQQGTPEYNDYIMKSTGKAGTTVNVGGASDNVTSAKPEQGYYHIRDPKTGVVRAEKIQGGSPAETQQKAKLAQRSKIDNELAAFGDLNPVIDRALGQTGGFTTGAWGSVLKNIPGGEAFDLSKNLETIQSDQALTRLVKLKEGGGTLGAVSEKELALLMAAKRNLEQSQSEDQFRTNLIEYKRIRNRSMQRIGEAYKAEYGEMPKGFEGIGQQQERQPQEIQGDASQMSDEQLKQALGL